MANKKAKLSEEQQTADKYEAEYTEMNPELVKAAKKKEQWEKAKIRIEVLVKKIQELTDERDRLFLIKDLFEFSETAKKRLDRIAIEYRTGRYEELDNAQVRKGKQQEPESLELYSRYRGQMFEKNIIRLTNRYLTGEFDTDELNRKRKRILLVDIKTRWNVFSYFKHYTNDMIKKEAAQLEGYCILGDCDKSEIANVLTNNSRSEIEKILKREAYSFDDPNDPDKLVFDLPTWKKIAILKNHIFDRKTLDEYLDGEFMDEEARIEYDSFVEIPLSERVIRQQKDSDPELQAEIIKVCVEGWKYLAEVWNLHNIDEDELGGVD